MLIISRPDIFWIVSDEYRCDGIGAYGNPWIQTPNLDRLAARGVLFRNAFCQSPICVASRASFMSGMYPKKTGNCWFERTAEGVPFVTDRLAEVGYRTVSFGKLHHRRTSADGAPRTGFSAVHMRGPGDREGFFAEGSPGGLGERFAGREEELGVLKRYTSPSYKQLIIGGTNPLPPEEAGAGYLAREAIQYLDTEQFADPLLFRLSFLYPHTPVLPPEPYDTLYDPDDMGFPGDGQESHNPVAIDTGLFRTRTGVGGMKPDEIRKARAHYYGLCSYVDMEIGRFTDYLEANWTRPYIVVFHSDHGRLLGEHDIHEKQNLYREALRVPLIIAGHGLPEGQVVERGVGLVDIAPTLLDFAGCSREDSSGMQGRSLRPLMEGREDLGEDIVFSEGTFMSLDDLLEQDVFWPFVFTEVGGRRGFEFSKIAERLQAANAGPADVGNIGEGYRFWRPAFKLAHTPNYSIFVRATWIENQGDDMMGALYDLRRDRQQLNNVFDDPEYRNDRDALIEAIKRWDAESSIGCKENELVYV